jgi:hypothetical protein
MAGLAHGFEMLSVIALRFVAKMRDCNTDFDLSSTPSGPCPRHTDFFATTFVCQAFAAALASHTTTCGRRPTPNIGSNLCFPVLWIIARIPFFPCASPFVRFWTLAPLATNGFPGFKGSPALSRAGFRCWDHRITLDVSSKKIHKPFYAT